MRSAPVISTRPISVRRIAGLSPILGHREHDEGGYQHAGGDRSGSLVVVFFKPDEGEKRGDFGREGLVAGNEDDRAEFAETARKGERRTGQKCGPEDRQDHAPEDRQVAAAERLRGFLERRVEVFEHRLHSAHDEGQAGERHRNHDADRRIGDADASLQKRAAEPAIGGEEGGQRDTGNGGRQGEGQVDDRVDEPPSGKGIADENPGERETEDEIEERGGQCGQHRDAIAGHRALGGDDVPVGFRPEARGLEDQRAQRQGDDEADIEERDAKGERQPGDDAAAAHDGLVGLREAPPSGLPAISPSRGEITRVIKPAIAVSGDSERRRD